MFKFLTVYLLTLLIQFPGEDINSPTIDELIQKVQTIRKQREDLLKTETTLLTELKTRVGELNKRLNDLGVSPDKPSPPIPPTPVDPSYLALVTDLKNAYRAETTANKAEQLKDLTELYKQAIGLTKDTNVNTTDELVKRVRDAANVLQINGLVDCRKRIAIELQKVMPTSTPLAPALRTLAEKTFTQIYQALKEVDNG